MAAATRRVRIPIANGVDSLNVGHAAAVAFAHLSRRSPESPTPGRNVASSVACRALICSMVVASAAAAPSWPMILLITARLAPPISSAWLSWRYCCDARRLRVAPCSSGMT